MNVKTSITTDFYISNILLTNLAFISFLPNIEIGLATKLKAKAFERCYYGIMKHDFGYCKPWYNVRLI